MAFLYELAILGHPSDDEISSLERFIAEPIQHFNLRLGFEIKWEVCPIDFTPDQKSSSGVIFFGCASRDPASDNKIIKLMQNGIPILPIVSDITKVKDEIPSELQHLNCLDYNKEGLERVANSLLECVGLLPRQRRLFLSYRRDESREAAVQLFDIFSSKCFEVFLDTYSVAPGLDFQATLWHRLCDSDVLVMLDTPNYFESRWTDAEYGRALAKGISILRIGWPDLTPSKRTATASRVELLCNEIESSTGRISDDAVTRICAQLEAVRSQSIAIRNLNLISRLRGDIEMIGGRFIGVGINKSVHIMLPNGKEVIVFPTVGIPTSLTLHEASKNTVGKSTAVIYDPVGLLKDWLDHLDWLGSHINSARWVKSTQIAWDFADWEIKK